ncbi:hypothetical protein ABE945_13195 [Enterococcus gilvus]|uniref:DUF2922 family protein n=1 Tax=Enterococcus gilvus TaxID=160453 RepID=UPI003D6C5402
MTNERTDLVTTFADGNGKPFNWRYTDVDTNLSPQEMKAACELLTSLDIFEIDGVKQFDTVLTGKLVTKKRVKIFEGENLNEDLNQKPTLEEKTGCFSLPLMERAIETALVPIKTNPQEEFPKVSLAATTAVDQPSLIKKPVPTETQSTSSSEEPVSLHSESVPSSNQAQELRRKPRENLWKRLIHRKQENVPDQGQ